MKLRNHASMMTQLPEGVAPPNFWSKVTQRCYQFGVSGIGLYLLYLIALQFIYFTAPGQIEISRTLISAAIAGEVIELDVEDNQQVKQGDRLLTIKPDRQCGETIDNRSGKFNEAIQLAELDQQLITTKINFLQQTVDQQKVWRALELGAGGTRNSAGSMAQDLAHAKQRLLAATRQVKLQKKLLVDWQQQLASQHSECEPHWVVAPFSATVAATHLRAFEYASRGDPLITLIARPAEVVIEMQVDEEDSEYYTLGDQLTVELPNGQTSNGIVSRLLSNASQAA